MGSPLSPIIADIAISDVEEVALLSLSYKPLFYYRYVDDIITGVPCERIEELVSCFNSIHERINFTIERSINNEISFLDINLIVKGDRIISNWYQKPTFSGRYLNYFSQHPYSHKKGVIIGLIDRVVMLSDCQFLQENLSKLIIILRNNNYPLKMIFSTLVNRFKYYTHSDKRIPTSENEGSKYFTIPYVHSVNDKLDIIFKKFNNDLSFTIAKDLQSFIKRHKDNVDKLSINSVVYKIPCRGNVMLVTWDKRGGN